MASCLQKIPPGNEFRAEGENDEMDIADYRERLRLKNQLKYIETSEWKSRCISFFIILHANT